MQSTSGSRAAPESDSQAPGYPCSGRGSVCNYLLCKPRAAEERRGGGVWQYRAGQRVSELLDTDFNGNWWYFKKHRAIGKKEMWMYVTSRRSMFHQDGSRISHSVCVCVCDGWRKQVSWLTVPAILRLFTQSLGTDYVWQNENNYVLILQYKL